MVAGTFAELIRHHTLCHYPVFAVVCLQAATTDGGVRRRSPNLGLNFVPSVLTLLMQLLTRSPWARWFTKVTQATAAAWARLWQQQAWLHHVKLDRVGVGRNCDLLLTVHSAIFPESVYGYQTRTIWLLWSQKVVFVSC